MYRVYLQRWYALAFGLTLVILLASLAPTRRRYWCGVIAYTVLAVGAGVAALAPFLFNIFMANAFNPHSVTGSACVLPILILIVAMLPALALYPFIRPATARRLAIVCFGIPTALAAISTVFSLFQPSSTRSLTGPIAGFFCVLFLLLWMRVYALRLATTAISPENSPSR